METKKTPAADLENKRIIFFLMGFAVVLSTFYVLMEWQSADDFGGNSMDLSTPLFIENEFASEDIWKAPTIEDPLPKPEEPEISVYEDYHVTDKALVEEEEQQQISIPENTYQETETEEEKKVSEITTTTNNNADIYSQVDTMPHFPGGQAALARYIYNHIQYHPVALKQRIQGRVWCSFVVNCDGSVSDVKLEEGIYVFLDEEAVRVLQMMPPWIPGTVNGEKVRVKIYLPVVFKI
jgi:protein TonB